MYCADVSCEWVSCLHPVGFLEFLPGNRNHHHLSDDVEYHELQLVCHCEWRKPSYDKLSVEIHHSTTSTQSKSSTSWWWSSPLWTSCWWMQEKSNSTITEYWTVEMKKDVVNAPHWPIEKWISVLAKGGGQKKRFQYCFTFRKYYQSFIARQCTVTRRFYTEHFTRRKRKRIEVSSEPSCDSRWSQSQNWQTSCVLHCCESDG